MAKADFKSVDEYIDSQPEAVRDILELVRDTIRKAIPQAQEGISYQMPTYLFNGERLLHFAVWKEQNSLYAATERVVAAFQKELAAYDVEKGTIRFRLSEAVPVKLIGSIVKFRARGVTHTGTPQAVPLAGSMK